MVYVNLPDIELARWVTSWEICRVGVNNYSPLMDPFSLLRIHQWQHRGNLNATYQELNVWILFSCAIAFLLPAAIASNYQQDIQPDRRCRSHDRFSARSATVSTQAAPAMKPPIETKQLHHSRPSLLGEARTANTKVYKLERNKVLPSKLSGNRTRSAFFSQR